MTEELPPARLPLVDNISQTFDKLPPINLFRAAANAKNAVPRVHTVHVPAVQAVAGQVAFFTTDGGTTALPSDGVLRPAKILRVEF